MTGARVGATSPNTLHVCHIPGDPKGCQLVATGVSINHPLGSKQHPLGSLGVSWYMPIYIDPLSTTPTDRSCLGSDRLRSRNLWISGVLGFGPQEVQGTWRGRLFRTIPTAGGGIDHSKNEGAWRQRSRQRSSRVTTQCPTREVRVRSARRGPLLAEVPDITKLSTSLKET